MRTRKANKLILLDVLRHMKSTNNPNEHGCGICGTVYHSLWSITVREHRKEIEAYLTYVISKWPKHSGDITYPIKGERQAYLHNSIRKTLWSKRNAYGRLRWELLDFCIDYLKQEVSKKNGRESRTSNLSK